ncbi:MAG: type II toxin-antitoxin system PrlF family antitoxin [Steroidobacteraceae bacterium]
MAHRITVKGQVTIPKQVRDALKLAPGDGVDFQINTAGEIVIQKAGRLPPPRPDRFDLARGTATIKWRTDELMALLRGDD